MTSKRKEKLPDISWFQKNFKYNPETGVVKNANGRTLGSKGPYPTIQFKWNGKTQSIGRHILVWSLANERWPKPHLVIDHIDQNKQNSKLSNLREVTHSQNGWNKPATGINKIKTAYVVSRGGRRPAKLARFCEAWKYRQTCKTAGLAGTKMPKIPKEIKTMTHSIEPHQIEWVQDRLEWIAMGDIDRAFGNSWFRKDLARESGLHPGTVAKLLDGRAKATRAQKAALMFAITSKEFGLQWYSKDYG